MQITREQARRFLLLRHGLLGAPRFVGMPGLLDYVRMVGCVQYDPVDVCGKSHELTLRARVKGFTPALLEQALYQDRTLLDYWDKNMGMQLTEDWPRLGRTRRNLSQGTRSQEAVEQAAPALLQYLREHGPTCAQELPMDERVDWYWSSTRLGRAALETLYYRGDLIVHHKKRTIKYYDLAENHLPAALLAAPNPCAELADMQAWQVYRRVGAVGLLWNAPSDAWLGVEAFDASARAAAFARLLDEGRLLPVEVESLKRPFYLHADEEPLLREACERAPVSVRRARLLAPLDNLLWDRKLIRALFDFAYAWEIYTPAEKLQYAHYVLPVLYGERFAGRVQPVADRKRGVLICRRFWPEEGHRRTDGFRRALLSELDSLRAFLGLRELEQEPTFEADLQ